MKANKQDIKNNNKKIWLYCQIFIIEIFLKSIIIRYYKI